MIDLMYKTQFGWDDGAKVWVAMCDDPAFALENESIVVLAERVEKVIPEMLELNAEKKRISCKDI